MVGNQGNGCYVGLAAKIKETVLELWFYRDANFVQKFDAIGRDDVFAVF